MTPGSIAKRPRRGRFALRRFRQALRPRLTLTVDSYCGSGASRHLHAMRLAAEVVGDIPVVGSGLAGRAGATLHVLELCLLFAAAADLRAHPGPRDGATGGREILTVSATDLVTENAADHGAGNGCGNVGAASILSDLLVLHPAALLRWSHHRAHRSDVLLVQLLVVAPLVIVGRCNRRGPKVVASLVVVGPNRGGRIIVALPGGVARNGGGRIPLVIHARVSAHGPHR